jgi:hypothetical protein
MFHRTFGDFVNKKKRDGIKHLEIMEKLLRKQGLRVESFLGGDSDDPYVYCFNPGKNTSFDGIRIYSIAGKLAFRVQKENKTHPYGRAYPLDLELMFEDFLQDEGMDEQKAGKKVVEAVGQELKRFFDKSVEAERGERETGLESDKEDGIGVRAGVTDYAALINHKS